MGGIHQLFRSHWLYHVFAVRWLTCHAFTVIGGMWRGMERVFRFSQPGLPISPDGSLVLKCRMDARMRFACKIPLLMYNFAIHPDSLSIFHPCVRWFISQEHQFPAFTPKMYRYNDIKRGFLLYKLARLVRKSDAWSQIHTRFMSMDSLYFTSRLLAIQPFGIQFRFIIVSVKFSSNSRFLFLQTRSKSHKILLFAINSI